MSSPTPGQTNLGIAPNLGGLLCYVPCCLGLIFAIVVAIVEKQSRFLRFHAFQSLLLHAIAFGIGIAFMFVSIGLSMLHLGIAGLLLLPIRILIGFGLFAACIYLMIQANSGEETELPVIGPMAKGWA
jgi:uncharacterized membrane protein